MDTCSTESPSRSSSFAWTHDSSSFASAPARPGVWSALVEGRAVVVLVTHTSTARVYRVARRTNDQTICLSRRERIVVERLGLGACRKEIGHALDLSASSVSRAIESAAQKLGLACSLDVVLLAAAFGPAWRPGRAQVLDGDLLELHAPLAGSATWARLSASEREVVAHALSGLTTEAIAALRGDRSCRTVSNQLAGAFRKAGVSGRAELAACLVRG